MSSRLGNQAMSSDVYGRKKREIDDACARVIYKNRCFRECEKRKREKKIKKASFFWFICTLGTRPMVDYTMVAPSMTARNCLLKRARRETLRWKGIRRWKSKRNEIFIDNNFGKNRDWKKDSKVEIKKILFLFSIFFSIFLIFSFEYYFPSEKKKKKKIEILQSFDENE